MFTKQSTDDSGSCHLAPHMVTGLKYHLDKEGTGPNPKRQDHKLQPERVMGPLPESPRESGGATGWP